MVRKGVIADGEKVSPRQLIKSQMTKLRNSSKETVGVPGGGNSAALGSNPVTMGAFINATNANGDQQTPEAAHMKVEDLEHPGDNALMLTMTRKAPAPPEGRGVGLGDTIHPSAIRELQAVGPPREIQPPGTSPPVAKKVAPALPPPPPPPPQY